MNTEILKNLITQYKEKFDEINQIEIYKWKAIKHFQDNWNIDAKDFPEMINEAMRLSKNLLDISNSFPKRMLIQNAEKSPEEVRNLMIDLFDEDKDYISRIKKFRGEFKKLNDLNFEGDNHYQGHKAVLVYLTLRFPERYYFYKYTMFQEYTKLIDYPYTPIQGRYENLVQYNHLCEITRSFLAEDQKLIKLHKERIDEQSYFDKNYHILTQDFIYSATRHLTKPDKQFSDKENIELIEDLNSKDLGSRESKTDFTARVTNHIENNIENKRIGDLGESWIVNYEIERLKDLGRDDLAKKVDYFAKNNGDGSGFDIISFDENGKKIYIEVKTTRGSFESAFFVSRNELEKSKIEQNDYYLYRLFNFDEKKKKADLKIIKGDLSMICTYPTEYRIKLS
ncbi:DUF3883 domain-containing protein [Zunongwangia sp. HGR-M22]|uniref:DUF3883 domain-containing protein n=1 Tax=Zunongwangia sp. HGR-M22 TaxID=3015168 RepID=UPI0022DE771C|nr:DUF3883 domain-containing protein [Zunongwangia sp. HGR-M22]WBL27253.1 DUF3883 domain-containing protein [Zunongwangia sp. HGR-M22]